MPKKEDDILDNYGFYENEEMTQEKQKIKEDYRDLMDKSLNIKSYIRDGLLKYTP